MTSSVSSSLRWLAGGVLSFAEIAMDMDVRSFSDFKKWSTWRSWLGPSTLIFALWVINLLDASLFAFNVDGSIGENLVQRWPDIPLALSILGMPALWFIWPAILFVRRWRQKSWLVKGSPALRHCRRYQTRVIPSQLHLQTTAILLGLTWGTFGLFTWLVNEAGVMYLHAFNIIALSTPNLLSMVARSMTGESRTMNKLVHFILVQMGPRTLK